jgi:MtN3 and saliva related transmembrane protein
VREIAAIVAGSICAAPTKLDRKGLRKSRPVERGAARRVEPGPMRQLAESLLLDLATVIGLFAAFCTTTSYYPQLKKCWETGSAGDLSLTMFMTLGLGVALWVAYGVMKADVVIVMANAVSLAFLSGILYFKLRERSGPRTLARKPQ